MLQQLEHLHIDHCIWTEQPENVKTVIALRPTLKDFIQDYLRHLKLYK